MEKTGSRRTDMPDLKLVEMALNNDQSAFSALLARYRDSLSGYVSALVPNQADVEDICQHSFGKAFMNIAQYDSKYAFSTWLYKIARNVAIDHLRRTRNTISPVLIDDDPAAAEILASDTPEDRVIIDQAVAEMTSVIGSLPELYREVAQMRFLNDCAYEEIAASLNIPLGTVKTRINRARKMLLETVGRRESKKNGTDR